MYILQLIEKKPKSILNFTDNKKLEVCSHFLIDISHIQIYTFDKAKALFGNFIAEQVL